LGFEQGILPTGATLFGIVTVYMLQLTMNQLMNLFRGYPIATRSFTHRISNSNSFLAAVREKTIASSQPQNGGFSSIPERKVGESAFATFPIRSVCKATIVGRTGAPPKLIQFSNGGSQLSFSVATNEVKFGDNISDEITQWNRVVVREHVPGYDTILKHLLPGSLVYVEGNLKISKRLDESQYTEHVAIIVSRSQGTFRVLQSPSSSKSFNSLGKSEFEKEADRSPGKRDVGDLPF
jgi:single-stranded DNA-binding protein